MKHRLAVLSVAGLLALGACAEDATDPVDPSLATASTGPVGINVVLRAHRPPRRRSRG
jgi:hypothetical protein